MEYFRGEVNYTLAGYVCKILGGFFTKKPTEFLKYMLEEEVTHLLLNHCESRSVGELITKILTHESTTCLEQRTAFFKLMLNRLSESAEIYVMSNLSTYVVEVIEKVAANLKGTNRIGEFNDAFFSLEVVTLVIKNVMSSEENVSIYNAPILFTYHTATPSDLPFTLPSSS